MRKLSRRAASIALAAAMLFTTAGVSQKKVEAASTGNYLLQDIRTIVMHRKS